MSRHELFAVMVKEGRSIAYAKGALAHYDDMPATACPYPEILPRARDDWKKGWDRK